MKGKDNVVVDTLIRWKHMAMATLVGTDLQSKILHLLPYESFYLAARAEIESQRPLEGRFDGFSLEANGLLRHRGRIYVPRDGGLR